MQKYQQHLSELSPRSIAILGIPADDNSSFMQGPALAPPVIRQAFFCPSANLFTELGVNLENHPELVDLGDLILQSGPESFVEIESAVAEILGKARGIISLGGDHAITYPIIKGFAQKHAGLNILHIDAHSDLYDNFENNPLSHASPFARIMETGLVGRLVQMGIRTQTDHLREQARRFNVEIIEARKHHLPDLQFDGPLYLALDLDVLDPAFAPGVSHHEPGGLSVRDVIDIIHHIQTPIIGADIVEYNPKRDYENMTAMVAAKLFKEIVGRMLVAD